MSSTTIARLHQLSITDPKGFVEAYHRYQKNVLPQAPEVIKKAFKDPTRSFNPHWEKMTSVKYSPAWAIALKVAAWVVGLGIFTYGVIRICDAINWNAKKDQYITEIIRKVNLGNGSHTIHVDGKKVSNAEELFEILKEKYGSEYEAAYALRIVYQDSLSRAYRMMMDDLLGQGNELQGPVTFRDRPGPNGDRSQSVSSSIDTKKGTISVRLKLELHVRKMDPELRRPKYHAWTPYDMTVHYDLNSKQATVSREVKW